MNRVLIVSDSHGLTNELRQIKDRHHALYNIHCGDSELVEDSPFLHEYITVKGNCDWKANFPKINKITINGVRFLITHGNLHHEKTSLLNLTLAAKEAEDRKSTRLNSSHVANSYAVFCLKKKN